MLDAQEKVTGQGAAAWTADDKLLQDLAVRMYVGTHMAASGEGEYRI